MTSTSSTIIDRATQLTGYGDAELVEEIYELVGKLFDEQSTEFYFLLAEAFERFAPSVELESRRLGNVDGAEGLRQAIESMAKRHEQRLAARAKRQRGRESVDA